MALNGCGHVFCGSCVVQWIKVSHILRTFANSKSMPKYPPSLLPGDPVPEPVSCPHCRHSPIQSATPCRLAKTMVGILLASRPDVARPPNEHRQAEALYKSTTGVIKVSIDLSLFHADTTVPHPSTAAPSVATARVLASMPLMLSRGRPVEVSSARPSFRDPGGTRPMSPGGRTVSRRPPSLCRMVRAPTPITTYI